LRANRWLLGACGVLLGCGRELVQTAEREPASSQPDCQEPGDVSLPRNANFGTGEEAMSALVGSGYAAGAGPGLFITARDAFRVYLNGELVLASRAARTAQFVPLSLLPGDNALSVVIAARSGTPAALLELAELERSYVSDATFRVSTAPTPGFASAAYDDTAWAPATDFGPLGILPGCDPPPTFSIATAARWVGPEPGTGSVAVLRKLIRVAPVGFGANTTGGSDAPATLVSTWEELKQLAEQPDEPALILLPEGSYDFRDTPRNQPACPSACSNDANKTKYAVLVGSAKCPVALVDKPRRERSLPLGSNKTLVGLGRGARIRGVIFDVGSSHDVVIRNLALYDVNPELVEAGDAFTLGNASQVWIDHCTTKWISDGFLDAHAGTKDVTLSWLHMDGVTSYECNGEHTRACQLNDTVATVHHTFFDHVFGHAPRVDGSRSQVHVFDNLLADDLSYGVGSFCGAQVLMEANTLQRVALPTFRDTCVDDGALGAISASEGSNYYADDVGPHQGGDGQEPHDAVFEPPYHYTVEAPQTTWLDVMSRAGASTV
jgi:pectate lyase